jgi:hypothetical protein
VCVSVVLSLRASLLSAPDFSTAIKALQRLDARPPLHALLGAALALYSRDHAPPRAHGRDEADLVLGEMVGHAREAYPLGGEKEGGGAVAGAVVGGGAGGMDRDGEGTRDGAASDTRLDDTPWGLGLAPVVSPADGASSSSSEEEAGASSPRARSGSLSPTEKSGSRSPRDQSGAPSTRQEFDSLSLANESNSFSLSQGSDSLFTGRDAELGCAAVAGRGGESNGGVLTPLHGVSAPGTKPDASGQCTGGGGGGSVAAVPAGAPGAGPSVGLGAGASLTPARDAPSQIPEGAHHAPVDISPKRSAGRASAVVVDDPLGAHLRP